jgi:hypothetical protein
MADQPKVKVYSQDDTNNNVRQNDVDGSVTIGNVVDTDATYSTTSSRRTAPNWLVIILLIIAAIILFNIIF